MTRRKIDYCVLVLPEVEDRAWPFVVSIIPSEPDIAFFNRFFVKQRELLERHERWVHLVDIRLVSKLPDARARHAVAEHTKQIEALSARYNAGTATVIKSSVVRGLLTAIHWLVPPPHPFSNVATPQEAVEFLSGCLLRSGMRVPSAMTAECVEIVYARVSGGMKARKSA